MLADFSLDFIGSRNGNANAKGENAGTHAARACTEVWFRWHEWFVGANAKRVSVLQLNAGFASAVIRLRID